MNSDDAHARMMAILVAEKLKQWLANNTGKEGLR